MKLETNLYPMTLADAIGQILSSIGEPLSISETIELINTDYLGKPIEGIPIDEKSLKNCLKKNDEVFNFKSGIVALRGQPHPVDDFENEIYKVLDIMRGYFKMDVAAKLILPQVFIFRIHQLAKEKCLPKKFNKLELQEMDLNNITDLCDIMNKINSSKIEELSDSLGLFINEFEALIGEEVFEVMFNRLNNNNYSSAYLKEEEFGKLYSSLIKNIFGDSTYRGEYLTSKLTKEIFSSIKFTPGEYKVLDPAFGIGESIIEFIKNQRDGVNIKVHGYEVQQETYGYGVMNLICNGIYSFDLKNKDCFKNEWKYKFDLIVSDPPINLNNGSSSFEIKLANKSRQNLNDNGRACFLVSNKILYGQGKQYQERKQWIHQKLLKKVISLPQGEGKEETNIAVSILYFENRKGGNNFLEFYDFDFTNNKSTTDLTDYADKLFSPIEIESSYYQKTNYDEVIGKDYNLLSKRYVGQIHEEVKRLKENTRANKLKNYLKRFSGKTPSDKDLNELSDRVIKIQDLKEDPFDAEINYLSFSSNYDSITKNDRYKLIDRDVLLIAISGEKLKPTYLKTEGRSFLIDSSIWAFKITGEVLREYLFYQLHSSFFRKQLKSIQRGSTIPYTPYTDLLNLYIKLPIQNDHGYKNVQRNFLNNKKQKAFEKAYREKKVEAEELKKKIDTVKYEDQTFRDLEEEELIEYMNHNVRNKLSPVKDSIELIYDYMCENEASKIDLNVLEGEPLEGEKKSDLNSLDDLFKIAQSGINNALQSLRRLEDFRLNEYKPEDFQELNLFKWLKQETNSRKKEYDIRVTTKEVNPEDVFNIKIVPSAIRDLFENLLENVEKHGFERELKNYKVLFELSLQDEVIIIDFKNDGNPLPKGFDEKKYFTSGAGAGKNKGSGFGGFFIARTLRKHNGSLKFIPTPSESNYTVHFRIKLPKNIEV